MSLYTLLAHPRWARIPPSSIEDWVCSHVAAVTAQFMKRSLNRVTWSFVWVAGKTSNEHKATSLPDKHATHLSDLCRNRPVYPHSLWIIALLLYCDGNILFPMYVIYISNITITHEIRIAAHAKHLSVEISKSYASSKNIAFFFKVNTRG